MNVEYINPFVLSVMSVFETMMGVRLSRMAIYVKTGAQPAHDVSGIIGLSGKAVGTVVLSLSREAAMRATEVLLGDRPREINSDVVDAVGELTNMIAGGAKAQLEQYAMSVSLPTVITGKCHAIEFPTRVTPICIPFDCELGEVTVEVGLAEKEAAAAGKPAAAAGVA